MGHSEPGPDVEATLFRAALLAGTGTRAQALAQRLANVAARDGGRSCLEAGSPLQFTVDAPGPARLRVGVRLGERLPAGLLAGLVPDGAAPRLAAALAPLPGAAHASLGHWLFWAERAQSLFADLRDPSAEAALQRLAHLLSRAQQARLERLRRHMTGARPWVLQARAGASGAVRLDLHWLLDRHTRPEAAIGALAPRAWPRAVEVLGRLLRRPQASGRWVVVTPLDDEHDDGSLRIGNSGWSLVPEDDRKHHAVGELMAAFGGPRDFAEALWSLCRGTAATPHWRVGRGCELKIGAGGELLRARLFFAPQLCTEAQSLHAHPRSITASR